jgi:hypothetical protein
MLEAGWDGSILDAEEAEGVFVSVTCNGRVVSCDQNLPDGVCCGVGAKRRQFSGALGRLVFAPCGYCSTVVGGIALDPIHADLFGILPTVKVAQKVQVFAIAVWIPKYSS